ncbi:MAG: helix-turn-helix domain-containing protein [Bacteroides sp.]|jgi:AraC-like DNA-binding protein|nr:helix-turn-helix domain-containing protein [Bacteroides sp.]MCI1683500.1 helix-turn-helix domain-containing protein [Bacteroides sp.]
MKEIDIRELNVDVTSCSGVNYIDQDIAVIDDLNGLSINNEFLSSIDDDPMRLKVVVVLFCVEGKLQVTVKGVPYVIYKDDVLFCTPNVLINNYMISTDFKGKMLCFSSRFIQQQLQSSSAEIWNKVFYITQNPKLHLKENEINVFSQYYGLIRSKVQQRDHIYHQELMRALFQAFYYDMSNSLSRLVSSDSKLLKQGELLFQRFIDLLSQSIPKKRFVSHYSNLLNVTPKYLSIVCKDVSGRTASEWINEYVTEDIRYRLRHSSKSIKEISIELDFPNISFFGKYVRAHLGMSPTEYRKS